MTVESINCFLNVFERVNRDMPFDGLRWFFDHAETVTQYNIERTAKLGGGFAIQDRMAFQGEHFIQRYGKTVGSKIVYAGQDFSQFDPPLPPVSPDWSPAGRYGGYYQNQPNEFTQHFACVIYGPHPHSHGHSAKNHWASAIGDPFWGSLGCTCFAF